MTPISRITARFLIPGLLIAPLSPALAESSLSGGIWGNYQYLPDNEANRNAWGAIGEEALIIYADGQADPDDTEAPGRWSFSAEVRAGPGSFTDPANNSTGDQWAVHQAWVGWHLNEDHSVKVGKSQVPFGWKTYNFWPGDIFLAGFGDQMDVGAKLSGKVADFNYDAAFYLADDWGSTSTDTVDDNGHWGSSTSYRKVQTLVGNLVYNLNEQQGLGVSVQSGRLQDLTGTPDNPVTGHHRAAVLYYLGEFGNLFTKASLIAMERELPDAYYTAQGLPERVENQRLAFEIGYNLNDWVFYLDASAARPDTDNNTADTITAWAPGARLDYGPGWFYVEYLTQDGFINRDGRAVEGDFEALYVTLDFYF